VSQDDTNDDSTVLPTVPHQVADCEIRAKCPYAAKSTSTGCPRDLWNGSLITFTSADVANELALESTTSSPSAVPSAPTNAPVHTSAAEAVVAHANTLVALVLVVVARATVL